MFVNSKMVHGLIVVKHCFTEFPALNECFVEDDFEVGAVAADPALCVIGPRPRPPAQRLVPTLVLKTN